MEAHMIKMNKSFRNNIRFKKLSKKSIRLLQKNIQLSKAHTYLLMNLHLENKTNIHLMILIDQEEHTENSIE